MSIKRTPVRVAAAFIAAGAFATLMPQAATVSYAAPTHSVAVASTKASALKIWTGGHYVKGADLDVYAYPGTNAKGVAFRSATVVGPHGIRATLTPAADAGYLVGTVHVPAALRGSWMRLTLVNPAGAQASVVVTQAAKKAATVKVSPVKLWADGGYDRDGYVDVNAYPGNDRHGIAFRSATVVGPAGMRTTLSPAADGGYLTGELQVPDALRGATIKLTLITPAGVRTSVLVKPAA